MISQVTTQRKNYWSLDVAKFFCAILIISSHFAAEWGHFPTLIDYVFSLYVIAVPFFFCCSGFLFFKKINLLPTKEDKKRYFIQYEKRILIMYALWSAVYFIHVFYDWVVDKELSFKVFARYLYNAVIFSSYSTIWFLPALFAGIAVTYFLVMRLSKRQITVIAVFLYIFGMLGYTYKFLIEGNVVGEIYDIYFAIFGTTRNGLFNGVPFVFMGYVLSLKDIKPSFKGFCRYAIPAGISLVFVVVEAFILKLKFNVSGMDVSIFIVPFIYFFVMSVLHIELKEKKAWLWCRKLSLLIFVSQRLFLSALPAFFPGVFAAIYANSYLGLLAVIGMTVAFSLILILLSNKIKFLKKMI